MLLLALAVFAMVKIPYAEAIRLWRGGEDVWYQNPKNAPPAWFNWFTEKELAESFAVKVGEEGFTKTVTPGRNGTTSYEFEYPFEFNYDDYPQEVISVFHIDFAEKQPFVSMYPDHSGWRRNHD